MRSAGITIDQGIRIATRREELPAPTRETILAAYQSPPMADMVRHMMKRSDNHFAEQLYVAVSHVKLGRGGYSESKKLEEEFLRRVRVPTAGVRKEDGSGLSELNTVTAESTVRLLQAMLNHPHGRAFVDSLAVSGRDGTLRSRMRDNAATDRVRAKTGFIQGVSCLSGYLVPEGQSAEPIAFSLLFNRLQGGPGVARATQDRICEMMVNALK
jgi:D-alanyl-D-alanine carboxypeptidase/D-alanyl-D-alanine-endopeptidase (penicillin-binding protein 4)